MSKRTSIAVLLAAAASASAPGQGGVVWQQVSPATSPSPRTEFSMVYDAARQRTVMFGGSVSKPGGTWEWDGINWLQRRPRLSAPWRHTAAMAYDSDRQRVVLFGGMAGTMVNASRLADTWEWDGVAWSQRSPLNRPPALSDHAMVYDSVRKRVVLFGGWFQPPGSSNRPSDETWEWDGVDWFRANPPNRPPAVGAHAMAFDPIRQRTVLFDGNRQETWEWDGSNWMQRKPSNRPPRRIAAVLVWDSARRRAVLSGGVAGAPPVAFADTWEWDGFDWHDVTPPTSAPARYWHGAAYDSARQRMVIFGGTGANGFPLNDTWELGSRNPATFASYGTGCGSTRSTLRSPALPWAGNILTIEIGNLVSGSVAALCVGASRASIDLTAAGWPGCTLQTSSEAFIPLLEQGGRASLSIPVPAGPGIVGGCAFVQGLMLSTGTAPLALSLTDPAKAVVGMR